jgi:hypothetical protein
MEINLKKIEIYELELPSGKTIQLEKMSTWNGMVEFKDKDGNKLICTENRFEIINSSFGIKLIFNLLTASPNLIDELQKV